MEMKDHNTLVYINDVVTSISDLLSSSFGPKGAYKIIIEDKNYRLTNDGTSIIVKGLNPQNPIAWVIIDAAKSHYTNIGDGVKSLILMISGLLKNAKKLIGEGLSVQAIINGYSIASKKSCEFLDRIALKINEDDLNTLKNIAMTSMTGMTEQCKKLLADIVINAVRVIRDTTVGTFDPLNIKLYEEYGGLVEDTKLIRGVVIPRGIVRGDMPKRIVNAKIALIDYPIGTHEFKKGLEGRTGCKATIRIDSPLQVRSYLEEQNRLRLEIINKIIESGANVVFAGRGVDPDAQRRLADKGILVVRNVDKEDLELLSKVTGGRIIGSVEDMSEKDLGWAGLVEERYIDGSYKVFVEECRNPKCVSIIVRGGAKGITRAYGKVVEKAIRQVKNALLELAVVGGGGATEVELFLALNKWAQTISGVEQYAVMKFSEAFKIIPQLLAINTGMNPIDALADLVTLHSKGGTWFGISASGNLVNTIDLGIIEPVTLKKEVIRSSTAVSISLLRINKIIKKGNELFKQFFRVKF